MRYLELRNELKRNIFTLLDVFKAFPDEKEEGIKIQLYRLAKKSLIKQIKRGLYSFGETSVDELELAGLLYQPSYISLETALNYYGLIPDIPLAVTSITLVTTKHIKTPFGNFDYFKIKPNLFFGFRPVSSSSGGIINIAEKEKSLLDYFYLRQIKSLADLRIDSSELDMEKYKKYNQMYPEWVGKNKML